MKGCGTCMAFSALHQQCRREAPKVFVIGVHPKTGPMTFGAWPPAAAEDPGCMQHVEDPAAKDAAGSAAMVAEAG